MFKKIILVTLALSFVLPGAICASANEDYGQSLFIAGTNAEQADGGIWFKQPYGLFSIDNVDLTDIQTVAITAKNDMRGACDGDRVIVRLGSENGEVIGYVNIDRHCPDKEEVFKGALKKAVSGKQKVYFQSSLANDNYRSMTVLKVGFQKEKYVEEEYTPVPDSALVNAHESTWALTDDLGRRAATYEETGPVREGKKVGMFYWTWHRDFETNAPFNNSEFAKEHPEAKYDYTNKLWPTSGTSFFWNEPLFGYYSGIDYWVYRKHAEMFAAAGVDVLFFDTTNGRSSWRREYGVLFNALHDTKADGVNAPKVCFVTNFTPDNKEIKENVKRIYLGAYKEGKWSDLWFYWEGKPLILAYTDTLTPRDKDPEDAALMNDIKSFFTFRGPQPSYTSGQTKENQWGWLEIYPQNGYTKRADGTFEEATVGVAANHSYIRDRLAPMNDEYAMGRSYTSLLGQDKTPGAYKYGYFFSEQLERALEIDPELMFIDGWNEWIAGRYQQWNGVSNAFPDAYDNEGSRDMEPTKGDMKDNYYALLVDAIRKFKGTEKREIAGAEKTIDIYDFSGWNLVTPTFSGYKGKYDRNYMGYGGKTYENYTKRNNVTESKVSRDNEYLYFYAKTAESITAPEGSDWMKIYIDSDRNHATGWEGYDYVINTPVPGDVSRLGKDGTAEMIGTAEYNVSGLELALKVNKALLGMTGTVDMEFKWVDNASGDILNWYSDGSVTPLGRFNFVYSEKEEVYLSDGERASLSGTAAVSVNRNTGYISGKKIYVCDSDSSAVTRTVNGVIYVTSEFAAEALGKRAVYEADRNVFKLKDDELFYTVLGTAEARLGGKFKPITNAVTVIDGRIYVPVTLFSEVFGYELKTDGNVAVFGERVTDSAFEAAKGLAF